MCGQARGASAAQLRACNHGNCKARAAWSPQPCPRPETLNMCGPAPHHPIGPRPRRVSALLTAALAGLPGITPSLSLPAQAQNDAPAQGLSGTLGLGAVNGPTYEGSARWRTMAGPDFTHSYRSRSRSRQWCAVERGPCGLMWQALTLGDFRVGLVAGVDPGRKASDTRMTDPTPGDRHPAGMGDLRAGAEAGLAMAYGPLRLHTRQSLDHSAQRGALLELAVALVCARR